MAIIDNLFEGGRGRLGNLVIYKRNGQAIVRTRPEYYHDNKSPAQMAQRQKLKVVNEFLGPFLKLIRITIPPQAAGRTARAEAQSQIMRNALEGEYPDIHVNKSKALLCHGPLPVPVSVSATIQSGGILIEWENGAEAPGMHSKDTLLVIAGAKDADGIAYSFTEAMRSDGQYFWKPALPEQPAELWMAFRNQEQTKMSNSFYFRLVPDH